MNGLTNLTALRFEKDVGQLFADEANALFARFTTPPTAARKALINSLIVALKAATVWTKLDAFYVLAAADSQAARQNWIADQYNLTPVSSPLFTIDRGYTGDGSAASLSTGFNPTTAVAPKFTQDSAHIGCWPNTDVAEDKDDMGLGNVLLRSRTAGSSIGIRINQTTTSFTAATITTSVGHVVGRRLSSAGVQVHKTGAQVQSLVMASVALSNTPMQILTSPAAGFTTKRLAAAHFGGSLSDAEILATYNALNTYLQAVGAAS